jgi:hypothetical protein
MGSRAVVQQNDVAESAAAHFTTLIIVDVRAQKQPLEFATRLMVCDILAQKQPWFEANPYTASPTRQR